MKINKVKAWLEVLLPFIRFAYVMISIASSIAAFSYYFVGDERDVANAVWYLVVALWFKMCSENISPAD